MSNIPVVEEVSNAEVMPPAEVIVPWVSVAEQLPPVSKTKELLSEQVLVAMLHPTLGWRYDVDTLSLGDHQYWMRGAPWSHWCPLPNPPL